MDDLEAATLASLAAAAAASAAPGGANLNLSSISEEDELKLLNFPPSKHEDLSTAIPLTVIFALLLVTGCIGNVCTAIVIARPKNKYMHTATNYYLFSLAMSDFLFLILGLPQEMLTLWQRYPYAFGESFCIIRGYLSEATTYASILTISAFTIERYVAICHPLWAHTMSQLPRAITSIVIIWLLAAVCAIPPAAELGIVTQTGPITHRTLDESAQCATKRTIYENMFVVSAIVFFIVPMIIVTVLYILIAIELRRSSKMNNAITKQSSGSNQHNPKLTGQQQLYSFALRHQQSDRLRGHLRSASRSQQQIAIDPACAHQLLPSAARQHDPAAAAAGNNLMASIMRQRPSSAIGTEHPPLPVADCEPPRSLLLERQQQAATGGSCYCMQIAAHEAAAPARPDSTSKQRARLFWPLLWASGAGTSPATSSANPACHCCPHLACSQLPAVHQSHSNLFCAHHGPNGSQAADLAQQHHRPHTPLSYHESIIERAAAQRSGPNNNNQNRHHLPPAHQLSLQHGSASYQSSGSMRNLASQQQQGSCQHYYHHHQPTHNQQHQHHHGGSSNSNRRSAAASSKKSVIRMLVAVVVSFFICWLPFHAQRLLASYLTKDENQNQFLLDLYGKITHISGVLYYLSSTINPLLYQLMSAKFRLAFKETFKCSLFKCFRQQTKSPTNSLKEATTHHPAAPHHGGTAPPPASSSCCNTANWQPPSPRPLLPHSRSSQPDYATTCDACCGPAATLLPAVAPNHYVPLDGRANRKRASDCEPAGGGGGLIARLRGRLDTSLASLFRLSGTAGGTKQLAGCANCRCCCAFGGQQPASVTVATNRSSSHPKGSVYNQLTSAGQLAEADGSDSAAASSLRVEVTLCNGGGRGLCNGCNNCGASATCPAVARSDPTNPLLGGAAKQSDAQQAGARSAAAGPHTMLKFVRNASPNSMAGSQLPVQPLGRLSSNEDEESQAGALGGSRPSGGRRQQFATSPNNLSDENNNTNSLHPASLDLMQQQQQHQYEQNEMSSLIEPTATEAAADRIEDELMQMQSLGLTSGESGNSSGSSPDQQHQTRLSSMGRRQQQDYQAAKRGWHLANKTRNGGVRAGAARAPNCAPRSGIGRRRRSLQQANDGGQDNHNTSGGPRSVGNRQMALATDLSEDCINQRRESSSSSTNKHLISSSLSSSDRQLDKKLSFSTTTSAIDDCGSSFEPTSSQLTGAGSQPSLAQTHRDLIISHNLSSDNDVDDDDEEEEEEATVINLHRCDDTGVVVDELMASNGSNVTTGAQQPQLSS